MLGRRINYQGFNGTIRYEGPILHEDRGDEVWVGIEWDDVTRGRHNGTLKDIVYFSTKNNQPSGSLLKKEKIITGVNILDAIFLKYFKEIPQQLSGVLDEEILQELKDLEVEGSMILNNIQTENEETKGQEELNSKTITVASQKQVLVEFDSNAFFEAGKRKKKKMVEFYGFNEIWQKINNLRTLKELSLRDLQISCIGRVNFMGTILKNLRVLSLEHNLLYSWQQVFLIGHELQHLQELSISHNLLRPLETIEELQHICGIQETVKVVEDIQVQQEEQKNEDTLQLQQLSLGTLNKICCLESKKILDVEPRNLFKNLKILVLIKMELTWQSISQVLHSFPNLEELVLCKNDLTDYENLKIGNNLQQLTSLNLEETNNYDFSKIQEYFGDLPNLQKLVLNRNGLRELAPITKFQNVTYVSLEYNDFSGVRFLSQLSSLPKLVQLNVKHNPIQEKLGRDYVRQRAIAEIGTLQIMNGSQLTKYERKDSEIYYMKSAFEQYFLIKKVPHYFYDFEDFLQYASIHHPRIPYLIKKFGNPYEIDPTVKGDFKSSSNKQASKVNYCTVKLIDLAGKMKGKDPVNKKFMGSTGIFPIKQVVAKLFNIPLKQVKLSIKVDADSELVVMDEKDRTLDNYGAIDGTEIFVDMETA